MNRATRELLDLAISRGWVTSAQIEESRQIQETVRDIGVEQDLVDILVKKGHLTADQLLTLRREVGRKRIGKYEILAKLGHGGSGIIYRARQEPIGRVVALKILSDERCRSERYLDDFTREARVAVTLNHENVVRGIDFGEADGLHYFAMELVEGESLYDLLEREGHLGEKRALSIAIEVVSGLRHAAGYSLIHQDVKPQNILITRDGVAKVCDLGLAKLALAEAGPGKTGRLVIATPAYISPERIRRRPDIDLRADVYSLGATLFHMVCGRPPFRADDVHGIIELHLRGPVPDPREWNLALSPAAASVIVKMLAKDAEDRYPSYEALAEDLEAVRAGRPPLHTIDVAAGRPVRIPVPLESTVTHRERVTGSRRNRLPWLLAGAAVIAVVAGIFILAGRDTEPARDGNQQSDVGATSSPAAEDPARERFLAAKAYGEANPDSPFEARVDRYALVVRHFPDTRWALEAKDRIRELTEARDAAARKARADALAQWNRLRDEAGRLCDEKKYGEALAKLTVAAEKLAETSHAVELKAEEKRIRSAANEFLDAVRSDVAWMVEEAKYADAIRVLGLLETCGIPAIDREIRSRLAEVRKLRDADDEQRHIAELKKQRIERAVSFRKIVGTACELAGRGAWPEAVEVLERIVADDTFAAFRREAAEAIAEVGAARGFANAVRNGLSKMEGSTRKLSFRDPARAPVRVRILGVEGDKALLAQGAARKSIPIRDLSAKDQVSIAFRILDLDRADDHRAAATYLCILGLMADAAGERTAEALLRDGVARRIVVFDLYRVHLEEKVETLLRRVKVLQAQKRAGEARDLLLSITREMPWHPGVRLELAVVLIGLGEHGQALEVLASAERAGADDPGIERLRGRAHEGLNQPEEALRAYTRFLEGATGGSDEAEAVLKRVTELRAGKLLEQIANYRSEAKTAARRRRWKEVIRLHEKILELDPEQSSSRYALANAWNEKGDVLQSWLGYSRYLADAPEGADAADARQRVRRLEAAHRKDARSTSKVIEGLREFEDGSFRSAVSTFTKAVDAAPLNYEAYYQRARAARELSRLEPRSAMAHLGNAVEDLDAAWALAPDEIVILEEIAHCRCRRGEFKAALAAAREVIEDEPARWKPYLYAGLSRSALGKPALAVSEFTLGLQRAPEEVDLLIGRALALEALDRIEDAAKDIEAAKRLRPDAKQRTRLESIMARLVKKRYGE